MLIIQKTYIKEFFKTLAILVFGLATVFSIIGLVNRVGDFLPHNPSATLLFKYAALSLPKYIHYLLPMAILLSSLFVFSQALKNSEIVVIKTATGKIKKILLPFVWIGILLTFSGFILGEFIVPGATKKMHEVKNSITKKEKKHVFREGTLYMRGKDGSIVRIGLYLTDKNSSKAVTVFKFDGTGLKKRIDAETAEWEGNEWTLKTVTIQDIDSGKTFRKDYMSFDGIESPRIFQEEIWNTEEMTIQELRRYRQRLNEAGFKNVRLVVYINSRLSYPLINLFMLLLGISLSIGGEQKAFQHIFKSKIFSASRTTSGIISAGLGLLISLAYWFGYSLFLSLGYAGTVPPAVAPWVIPSLFAFVAVYLYSQIPE